MTIIISSKTMPLPENTAEAMEYKTAGGAGRPCAALEWSSVRFFLIYCRSEYYLEVCYLGLGQKRMLLTD